jgi:(p)ppGpp synthase/HD superfamily hydrolase
MNAYRPQSSIEGRAYATAHAKHAGKRLNPFSNYSFIERPKAVAHELANAGYGQRTIAAGLLYAVPEHDRVDGVRTVRKFGHDIASLVETVSPNPSVQDPSEQHEIYLARLFKTQSMGALSLAAAIDLTKVNEILRAHELQGDNIWAPNGFNKEDSWWFATTSHQELNQRIPGNPIVVSFGEKILQLKDIT